MKTIDSEVCGRSGILRSGYRSLLRFKGSETDFGFELELSPEFAVTGLRPGETGTARLSFWAAEELPGVFPDLTFELREGARVVGEGTIASAS